MIYEVHEIAQQLFNYKFNEDDILVFDDALYSQYMYKDDIKNIQCCKYIAVSPILLHNNTNKQIYTNRNVAMWKLKELRDTSAYMTLMQLKEILNTDTNMHLCMHGYSHIKYDTLTYKYSKLKYSKLLINEFCNDVDMCINWFKLKFNYIPEAYCHPYNFDYNGIFSEILRVKYNITYIYGKERTNIDFNDKIY